MKKRIINYRLKIDNLLANPDKISKEEWKKILQEHLTQIAFFQHERLVHLIVTVTFAITHHDVNNRIYHDKQPNASCTYTVILSAVGAVYHALLYTGK